MPGQARQLLSNQNVSRAAPGTIGDTDTTPPHGAIFPRAVPNSWVPGRMTRIAWLSGQVVRAVTVGA